MSSAHAQGVPAWQTEELQDEWPDSEEEEGEEEEDGNNISYGTQSVSFTVPLSTQIHSTADFEPDPTPSTNRNYPAGTFLVREEIEHAPLVPKTPGRNNKKGVIKDFFTPMPLERMFEPPSPPYQSSEQQPEEIERNVSPNTVSDASRPLQEETEDEIIETDMPNMSSFHGRKPNLACQFTFSVPRPSGGGKIAFAQAQSTPNPPHPSKTNPPPTDPRLRLFQFQYDTYTREHLSALVDSIAVNTPSGSGTGTTATPTSFGNGLSRVSEASDIGTNMSHLRSTKRLKLSPSSDLCVESTRETTTIARPKLFGKDYVGESRNLMEQIKQARDFSTISSVASAQNNSPSYEHIDDSSNDNRLMANNASTPLSTRLPSFLSIPEQSTSNPSNSSGTVGSKSNSYSSIGYRQKAEALMGQIKGDMKRQKRIFSGDSELSHVTTHVEEDTNTSNAGSLKKANGKEHNRRASSSSHRRTSSLKKSGASPMKFLKTQAEDTELAHNLSRISIHEPPVINITLIPPSNVQSQQIYHESERPNQHLSDNLTPAYPSTSIRITTNDDLNRFVSSSTASGTTVTAGSVPSFVKHPGPAQIRTIAPADLPSLPERFGDMLFDKVMMRWVKNTANSTIDHGRSANVTGEVSDDPFGDIESLNDSRPGDDDLRIKSGRDDDDDARGGPIEMSIIQEQSEVEDEEEMELSNFSTDASAHILDIMAGVDTDGYEDETTDSDDEADEDLHTATRPEIHAIDFDSEFEDSPSRNNISRIASPAGPSPRRPNRQQRSQNQPSPRQQQSQRQQQQFLTVQAPASLSTPNRGNPGPLTGTPIIKSALKSGGPTPTPTSVLRSADRRQYQTPLQKTLVHRRSVSFSDGKREGPIQGIKISASGGAVQSTRSKRIADMMNALEDSDVGDEDDSPSKTSTSGRPEELQPLHARQPSISTTASKSPSGSTTASPRRVFSRSYSQGASPRSKSLARANGTFLTECSFGVAHDRLVEVITDVQPFEPHWEELASIDLSDAKLESVARLKEFLPRLDALSLNRNELAWLSGIPATVRTLSVANNCLTGITSYSHLLNLENLDICHNDIESLRQLECLRHLRELKADGNKICTLDGLQRMDGLVKLSLQANKIKEVDLTQYRWTRLEMLNVSHNRVERVHGLTSLQSLIALNMDMNSLPELVLGRDATGTVAMSRLRILRVSGNKLRQLDVGALPNLRTLYADNNALEGLDNADRLGKLENLSMRNQSGKGLNLLTRDVRDVKRLYLSGNPIQLSTLLSEPCYNLVYLEIAACRLTALPATGLAAVLPNLRVLNLNYNFLEDVRPLAGLVRLQKLTVIGSRLKSTKPIIRLLGDMKEMEMLDFRMNPCTLGWYLPLLVKDIPGALQPSEGKSGVTVAGGGDMERSRAWQELDSKFRRDLPDGPYIGRLAYRGLIMRGCVRLAVLDGVVVGEKERAKAQGLLEGILGRR